MTTKSWRDLYQTGVVNPGDKQLKIDGAEFMARSGTQAPFDLDSVDVEAINTITTRTIKNGRENFVAALGQTGLDFYAPAGAKLAIRGEEIIFTPEMLQNQAVYFVPDPALDPPVEIHGVAIQCSGYFRLLAPKEAMLEQEPFSAIELDEGHNTGTVGDGQVYPPGGYIFHFDGSAPIGIDMLDRYTLNGGVNFDQPSGYKSIYIELYRTAVPDLYMALYSGETVQLVNLDTPEDPLDSTSGFDPQGILTVDRLRTILINIFSAASKDPTGEGYVYLPWKYERWYKPEQGTPDWNLSAADVSKLNAAVRTTNPANKLDNYVGPFVTAPGNALLRPRLDLYASSDVVLFNGNGEDGAPTVGVKIEPNNPKTKTLTILSGQGSLYGVMDVYIHATTPFSFYFTAPDNPSETLGLKVVRAYDPTINKTILLIDGSNYSLAESIFPRGDYIFRPYEKAGFTFSVLESTTLPKALPLPGSAVELTRLRQTAGRDYYNAWFETAGVPKIVNSVDPKDQLEALEGLIQSEPAELEDVEGLESLLAGEIERLEALIGNFSIWKVETWVGYAYTLRPFAGADVTGGNKIDLGNGVSAQSFSRGNETFKLVNGGLVYTDANRVAGSKTLLLQQTTEPYIGQIQMKPSHPFKLAFYKPNDPSNTQLPYDGNDIVAIDNTGKALTAAAATGTLLAGQYTIRLNVPADIAIDYGQAKAIPSGTQFTIEVTGPSPGAPAPFSVVYGMDGKIRSVTNNNDVNDRRPDTSGMRLLPTLIEEEIGNEQGATIEQLVTDLRSQIDTFERSVGFDDLGNSGNSFTVDWSRGKVKKALNIDVDPVTITFVDPPNKEELFFYLTTSLPKQPTIKLVGNIKGIKTNNGVLSDPPTKDHSTAFHFFFDGSLYTDFGKS